MHKHRLDQTGKSKQNYPDKASGKLHSSANSREAASVERVRQSNSIWSSKNHQRKLDFPASTAWKRQTWTLPREEARLKARAFLDKFPRAAYWSEVETWRVLPDGQIEFTMRRLPTAD